MSRISIVICSRNRAASLARTLAAIGKVALPAGAACEVLVVDNGSTDNTATAVSGCHLENAIPVRYLNEPIQGLARARNSGIAVAGGDIIVFTDDDVIPSKDWLTGLCAPILAGQAEAVAGGVRLALHLVRPWMNAHHRAWLAGTDELDARNPSQMVGANMAFARRVLQRVPAFDPELGSGAIGFGEDTLFSLQLREAGYRIAGAFEASVEHHFREERLRRSSWISAARNMGRTDAYLAYHWENSVWPRQWRVVFAAWARRAVCSMLELAARWKSSVVTERLLNATRHLHAHLQYLRESKRPRNYARHGLVKLALA